MTLSTNSFSSADRARDIELLWEAILEHWDCSKFDKRLLEVQLNQVFISDFKY